MGAFSAHFMLCLVHTQKHQSRSWRIWLMEETLISLLVALISALIIFVSFEIYIGL